MSKNIRLRFAVLGTASLLAVAGACGAGDDDVGVAVPASSTSAVPATATTLGEPPATAAPTTPTTVGTTTSTTITTTTTISGPGTVEIVVSVEAGSVEGGGRIRVGLDTEVRMIVAADVADEVHVHGYRTFVEVTPGTPARLEFVATIPGIFEVELESSSLVLVELVVEP